jgi:hypothetical protein
MWAAGLASVVYVVLAIRFAMRVGSSDLNSSARGFFLGVLATTVVLFVVAVAMGVSQRDRAGAAVPALLAALFGIFVCIVFYGP